MATAQEFWDEFAPRVKHVHELVIGAKSKQANYGLMVQDGVSLETLRQVRRMVDDEIKEREREARILKRRGEG